MKIRKGGIILFAAAFLLLLVSCPNPFILALIPDKSPPLEPVLGGTAVITGAENYRIGEELGVDVSGITGGAAPFRYQWKANGENITGAVEETYIIEGSDAGKRITCAITHDIVGGEITATGEFVPYNVNLIIEEDGKAEGDAASLETDFGLVGDPITIIISVANTQATNRLEFSGVAGGITAVTEAANTTRVYTIAAVDAVDGVITITAMFIHTADIYLDGEAVITGFTDYRIGEELGVDVSGINGGEAPFNYQWQTDGEDIDGADEATYTIQSSDAGKEISCVITHDDVNGEITATGEIVPYEIELIVTGEDGEDSVEISPEFGLADAVITVTYTVDGINEYNQLIFNLNIDAVEEAEEGAREYTVNADDAVDGVITITAVFIHTDSEPTEGEFEITITVISEIGDETIIFADMDSEVELELNNGDELTLEISGDYDSYTWLINGIKVSETGNVLTISSSELIAEYSTGDRHQILVIVYKEEVPYSGYIYFSVK